MCAILQYAGKRSYGQAGYRAEFGRGLNGFLLPVIFPVNAYVCPEGVVLRYIQEHTFQPSVRSFVDLRITPVAVDSYGEPIKGVVVRGKDSGISAVDIFPTLIRSVIIEKRSSGVNRELLSAVSGTG